MKKKILSLTIVLCIVCTALSSCGLFGMGGGYITEKEAEELIAEKGTGSTNNINITVEGENNVITASRAVLSTVSIECNHQVSKEYGMPPFVTTRYEDSKSWGSGVIYKLDKASGDAYIITNYHVVYEKTSTAKNGISNDIKLYLYGMEYTPYAISATYVGGSMSYDLALLKVEGSDVLKQSAAEACSFENSDDISILESVVVIGNPAGAGISATAGFINVDSEYITMYGADGVTEITLRVIRTNAPINSGNSGGGMFDSEGNLLGIINAKIVDDETDNIGYAIPSNIVKYVTENILYYCDGKDNSKVYRCILGIVPATSGSRAEYDTESGTVKKYETVIVESLTDTSAVKGMLEVGDVINHITIDGVKFEVTRRHNVIDSMINARVGSTVVINVTRGDETFDVTVVIDESTLTAVK